ncbi:hypothetical protein ACLOJK_007907 [Asimina triloba]
MAECEFALNFNYHELSLAFHEQQYDLVKKDGYKVSLNVYDLSQGLARQLSTTFLGKVIEGIWLMRLEGAMKKPVIALLKSIEPTKGSIVGMGVVNVGHRQLHFGGSHYSAGLLVLWSWACRNTMILRWYADVFLDGIGFLLWNQINGGRKRNTMEEREKIISRAKMILSISEHTGVVVYGNEYYFGGGIQQAHSGTTPYGTPIKVVDLGVTHVPKDIFEEYLQEISPRYTAETYSLLRHNCNNFSNEVAQFLVGVTIPDYILNLPNEVLSSPMGAMILPTIQQLEMTLRQNAVPQAPQFRPTAATQPSAAVSGPNASSNSDAEGKPETRTSEKSLDGSVPPAVKSAEGVEKKNNGGAVVDPLGDARSRVQEEISKEFAAIMASGTLRASEAAALATRRVMERHGRMNAAPMTQG